MAISQTQKQNRIKITTQQHSKESFVNVWQDVIAGVGGLIGLFCGLSILSFVEILT